jgi:hypothetical protein
MPPVYGLESWEFNHFSTHYTILFWSRQPEVISPKKEWYNALKND